jgi:hypothetical protein
MKHKPYLWGLLDRKIYSNMTLNCQIIFNFTLSESNLLDNENGRADEKNVPFHNSKLIICNNKQY